MFTQKKLRYLIFFVLVVSNHIFLYHVNSILYHAPLFPFPSHIVTLIYFHTLKSFLLQVSSIMDICDMCQEIEMIDLKQLNPFDFGILGSFVLSEHHGDLSASEETENIMIGF